ncbi:hypothetical protein BKA82DRAFT_31431 [Pisolithus tinctorius]|uniref:Uncharacterized protein n=1 Tax=Pisolithus tinctorius Marx 270 TaxID=870435 RepID=A0A0C3NSE7_PISTI|nr:hypothetical protein BKA82DRAFT_31431 [Pisolithus tinctorius]KIN98425.1 hypothetical protein M404DRAFT_31431 [Pisolithus tinctorius Marx 270]
MLGESLLIGGGGRSQKATLDDKAQAHQELEKGAKRVIVGIVIQMQVTNLMNSFLQNGLDRFNVAHTIPLVIDKRWIKKDSYMTGNPMDLDIDQIPLLEIDKTIAMKNWSIPAAGGQHCDIDEKLGLFISQNKHKHMYVEAPAEGLIQRFKEALVLGHKWYNIPHARVNAGPVGKQTELLSQDYAFKLMSFMNSASTHYIHSPIFNLNKLHAMMMSPGGRIIAYVMSALEEKLALCFNTVEFTMAEFKDLNKKASKCDVSVEKDQARDHLWSILNTLKQASPLRQVIVPKVQDVTNVVFAGHLVADSKTLGHLCQALSFIYQSAFD